MQSTYLEFVSRYDSDRAAAIAGDVRAYLFDVLDNEPDTPTEDAARIAAEVEKLARRLISELRVSDRPAMAGDTTLADFRPGVVVTFRKSGYVVGDTAYLICQPSEAMQGKIRLVPVFYADGRWERSQSGVIWREPSAVAIDCTFA